jgi:hypothetical protein
MAYPQEWWGTLPCFKLNEGMDDSINSGVNGGKRWWWQKVQKGTQREHRGVEKEKH